MDTKVKIAPSLLAADFTRLGEEVRAVEEAGAHWLHVDVMDGHFVPNLTMGPGVVGALYRVAKVPLDVHLMIDPYEPWLERYVEAGAKVLTVHQGASGDIGGAVAKIKSLGVKAGVALSPGEDISCVGGEVLEMVDVVLVMTVHPGFGGQSFMEERLPVIEGVRERLQALGSGGVVEVDGGIDATTARAVREAGAQVLVAGTAIFGGGAPYGEKMARLQGVQGVQK